MLFRLKKTPAVKLVIHNDNYLEFKFGASQVSGTASGSIDNVEMYQTAKFTVTQTIQRRSSNNSLLQSFVESEIINFAPGQVQYTGIFENQKTFPIFKNERVNVILNIEADAGSSQTSEVKPVLITGAFNDPEYTSFKTVSVDDGGGDILPVNPNDFPIYKYEFKKALTFTEWEALRNDPKSAVLFSKNKVNHIFGWRNSIEYDRKTSETSFVLRSKTKINTDC